MTKLFKNCMWNVSALQCVLRFFLKKKFCWEKTVIKHKREIKVVTLKKNGSSRRQFYPASSLFAQVSLEAAQAHNLLLHEKKKKTLFWDQSTRLEIALLRRGFLFRTSSILVFRLKKNYPPRNYLHLSVIKKCKNCHVTNMVIFFKLGLTFLIWHVCICSEFSWSICLLVACKLGT